LSGVGAFAFVGFYFATSFWMWFPLRAIIATCVALRIHPNILTLVGMIGVMLYLNWRFTLIALSVSPVLFLVVYYYTRRIKKASRAVRKKEGELAGVAVAPAGSTTAR
jgi:ABC-type multidrug transport system fused ATPase/permease subunit